MKRLLCLLLTAVLLLGGCALTDTPEPSETEAPTQATQASTEAPAEPHYTTTAGGITVKSDYSAYTARVAPEAKYTRLSEGPLPELLPSEDYGAIYPYIGSELYSSEYDFSAGYLYGMVDENGRILTDPVYTSAALLSDYGVYRSSPFWLLERVGEVYTNEYGYETADRFYALAALDGSFVTDCIYTSATGSGDVALATRQVDDETVLEVIDASGRLIYSSLEHPFEHPLYSYAYGSGYSDGILRLYAETGEYSSYESWDGETEYYPIYGYYFADLDGNLLGGPYQSAGSFSSGYSAVELLSGSFALIDREGAYLANTEFLYAGDFINGYACVDFAEDGEGPYCFINPDGEIVNELVCTDPPNYFDGAYHVYEYYYDYGTTVTEYIYDYRGELLYCDAPAEDGWSTVNQYIDALILYDGNYNCRGGDLRNKETGATYEIPEGYQLDYSFQSYVLLNRYDDNYRCVSYVLLDKDLNEISSGRGSLYQLNDSMTGTSYIAVNGSSLRLYDMEMNELCVLPGISEWNQWIYGGRTMLLDDFSCSYYDLDGNLLFRYLRDDATGD